MATPLLTCLALAAAFQGLPPRVLASIHAVEGGNLGSVRRNADNSQDLGPMQVNTLWLPALARYTGLGEAEVRDRLIGNACFGATAAGAILRTYLIETRGDLMRAIGYYHSHTPALGQRYQLQVVDAATQLFGGDHAPSHPGRARSEAPPPRHQGGAPVLSGVSAPRKATIASTSARSR